MQATANSKDKFASGPRFILCRLQLACWLHFANPCYNLSSKTWFLLIGVVGWLMGPYGSLKTFWVECWKIKFYTYRKKNKIDILNIYLKTHLDNVKKLKITQDSLKSLIKSFLTLRVATLVCLYARKFFI